MVKNVKILLEKPTNVYQPGEIVIGRLYVEAERPKPYKTISVSITGNTVVNTSLTLPTEKLYKDSVTLWQAQKAEDGSTIEFPPGSYDFTFQFVLPVSIPSSFEGRHGKIWYNIQGKLSSGLLKTGHTVNHTITVFNSVTFDNPVNPHVLLVSKRYDSQNTVNMACCNCISGPVSTSVHLPRTGFCIGEMIPFSVDITNNGPTAVQLVATLKCQESYTVASGNRKTVFRIIGSVSSNVIQRRESRNWSGLEIPIGMNNLLSLVNCERIRIEYIFELKVNIQRVLPIVSTNSILQESISIFVADASDRNTALLSQYGFAMQGQNIPHAPVHTMSTRGAALAVMPYTPVVNPQVQFGSLPRTHHSYYPQSTVPLRPPVTNRSMSLPVSTGPPPTNYNWSTIGMAQSAVATERARDENDPIPSAPALTELEEIVPALSSPIGGVVSPQLIPDKPPPSYEELETQNM